MDFMHRILIIQQMEEKLFGKFHVYLIPLEIKLCLNTKEEVEESYI